MAGAVGTEEPDPTPWLDRAFSAKGPALLGGVLAPCWTCFRCRAEAELFRILSGQQNQNRLASPRGFMILTNRYHGELKA